MVPETFNMMWQNISEVGREKVLRSPCILPQNCGHSGLCIKFLADRTYIKVQLFSWFLSICLSFVCQ